jgi:hypothetical protein
VTHEQTQPVQPGEAVPAPAPTGYAVTWALFTDWCDVTGNTPLPADPTVVAAFLADCPAAPATQRRRMTAIDHHHTATGYAPPGKSPELLAALGRSAAEPGPPTETVAAVDATLRWVPSHGWTHGVFGRRDRCLLVLSQLARVPYRHLATLTAGDITFTPDGTARITTPSGGWSLHPGDDPVVCAPCTVARWLKVLDVVATRISTSAVADHLGHAVPVTTDSPHACRSDPTLNTATLAVPLLPPINQWGAMPFPHPQLTPHATSHHARNLLGGDIVIHRTLPFPDEEPAVQVSKDAAHPLEGAAARAGAYTHAVAKGAWVKRRRDLDQLVGVGDALADVDRKIAALQLRVNSLLDNELS